MDGTGLLTETMREIKKRMIKFIVTIGGRGGLGRQKVRRMPLLFQSRRQRDLYRTLLG